MKTKLYLFAEWLGHTNDRFTEEESYFVYDNHVVADNGEIVLVGERMWWHFHSVPLNNDLAKAHRSRFYKEEEKKGMNLTNIAALINDQVTTIDCQYEGSERLYTFKCHRKLADKLQPGDGVIVNSAKGIKVTTVADVHEVNSIDPEAKFEYQWAFDKVDYSALHNLQAEEQATVKKLEQQRREKIKEQALNSIGAHKNLIGGTDDGK